MPLSPTHLFVCTDCGAVLPVDEELVGKKCRCGRCGNVSVVMTEAQRKRAEQGNKSIHFNCRVCDTHLAAQYKHVGRKAKCPDCGALTEVPPPPKEKKTPPPPATHGQQYGLWGVDEAPLPAELAKRQPKFFPVYCRVCDTLMHAQKKQIGKQLTCPDCHAQTIVEEPPAPKTEPSVLVPDGREYQLDATHIPPPRPELQFQPPEPRPAETKKQEVREQRQPRPKIPRFPTMQGISSMLLSGSILGWWLWLSVVALLELVILNYVASEATGVIGLVLQIFCYAMAFSLGAIWLSAASALWLRIFTESSEGNDRLHHPPGINFFDWFGDMIYIVIASTVALAPWWLLSQLLRDDLAAHQRGLLMICGWLFTYPLLQLSLLENGSPLEPFSPKILGSVLQRPGHWLLLTIQSMAIVGGCVLATMQLVAIKPLLALLAVPLGVAASLLYFRILGRFAWWLAESLPAER